MVVDKIKFNVPHFIYELFKADSERYKINNNKLCNIIFRTFYDDYNEWKFKKNLEKSIQFRLSVSNLTIYKNLLKNKKIDDYKARYFRNLVVTYLDNKPYHREKIIYANIVSAINHAIKKKNKIIVNYKNFERILEPYELITTKEEKYNYLLCWCSYHEDYRNYRLSNLKNVNILKSKVEHFDEDKIKKLRQNFDPFLIKDTIIRVKFTDKGKNLFENTIYHNRPEVINKKGNIYRLKCSEKKAEIYLSSFFDEVEILEPQSFRNNYYKKIKNILDIYNN